MPGTLRRLLGRLAVAILVAAALALSALGRPNGSSAEPSVSHRQRSYVNLQWPLRVIRPRKLELGARSKLAEVTVATIDTGIDFRHPDLVGSMWRNPQRTPAPLAQGVVPKGAVGWDLLDGDPQPTDIGGHGTVVAGLIAAQVGNGFGVDGVAPNARLMALRACTKQPTEAVVCSDGSYAAAITWAASHGARIVHLSWSVGGGPEVAAAVAAHPEVLFVATSGNGYGINVDASVSNCNLPDSNLICVGTSTHGDRKARCSSVGPHAVDLAAPGKDVSTTLVNSRYLLHSHCAATFAAPHVTGVAALLFGAAPSADPLAVKRAILAGARPAAAFRGLTVTGGILSAPGALRALGP